jgi:ADP-ribose pyrophosphatase YjhB (NUDIX family)
VTTIRHCTQCGTAVNHVVPEGDNRARAVCPACGHIEYQNPKIVAGCIAEWGDKIVIAKRAIEPRHGYWTLPAGFMELGESAEAGAAREAMEEANAHVECVQLYMTFSVPHISQVYLLFRARLLEEAVSAGPESLEAKLITEHEVPWGEIAFPMVAITLKHYFADRKRGVFRPRFETLYPVAGWGFKG